MLIFFPYNSILEWRCFRDLLRANSNLNWHTRTLLKNCTDSTKNNKPKSLIISFYLGHNSNDSSHIAYSLIGFSVLNCMESKTHFSSTHLTCLYRTEELFPTNRQEERVEATICPPHNVINSSKSCLGGILFLLTQMAPQVLNKSRLYTGPNDNFCKRHRCKRKYNKFFQIYIFFSHFYYTKAEIEMFILTFIKNDWWQ